MTVIVIVLMGLYVLIKSVIALEGILVSFLQFLPTPKSIDGLFPVQFK